VASELILIVEDNDKNMKLLRDLLNFNGYRTIEAVTAEKGIDLAKDRRPALILMDIQLPQMDGISAFRHLQADSTTNTIPVIAVTASATKQECEEILATGFDGLEVKPIKLNQFLKKVREVLGGRSTTRGKPREA
jgi:two-component system cell cycle response regulator DivK